MTTSITPFVGYTGEGDLGSLKCDCGLGAILRDAWTEKNVGRRFYESQNYGNPSFWGFHTWYDAPTPPHLLETILGVRAYGKYTWKKLGEAESEVEKLKQSLATSESDLEKLKSEHGNVLDHLSWVEVHAEICHRSLKWSKRRARI